VAMRGLQCLDRVVHGQGRMLTAEAVSRHSLRSVFDATA
jgi:hypothetical protein